MISGDDTMPISVRVSLVLAMDAMVLFVADSNAWCTLKTLAVTEFSPSIDISGDCGD